MADRVLQNELPTLHLQSDPIASFEDWFREASTGGQLEPEAMCVSSFDSERGVSSRMVLLRRQIDGRFHFFTNYNSRKSHEFESEPRVSLLFHWRKPFHRQIRIEGAIKKSPSEVSDEYFATRSRGSQISAWASPQSEIVKSREDLDSLHQIYEHKFKDQVVTRPPFWGGWEITPQRFEFWQEREFRYHDRIVFIKGDGSWKIERIAP